MGGWGWGPQLPEVFGGLGVKPPDFCNFLKKKAISMPLDLILQVLSEPFESTRFLTFKSQLKKSELFNPPFTCNLSPKHV